MGKSFRARGSSSLNYLKVTVYWGDVLYDTILCGTGDGISIGTGPRNDIVVPIEGKFQSPTVPLIQMGGEGTAELRFVDGIEGHVYIGEKFCRLNAAVEQGIALPDVETGGHMIRLGTSDRGNLVIGHLTFDLTWGRERVVLPKYSPEERRRSLIMGATMTVLIAALMAVITLVKPEHKPEEEERVVEILTAPPPPPPKQRAKAAIGERKTADGGAQKGEPGKADLTKAAPKPLSAAEKLRQAFSSDSVGELADFGTAAAPNVAGKAKTDDAVAAAIEQVGTGGFSTIGDGKGGGGKSVGIGRTVGQGEGGFGGTGRLGLSGNSLVEGGTGQGTYETQQEGGLERDVIDTIVRKRKDRIRLCYERQLNFVPDLAGKITVHFVIGEKGQVLSASLIEDTMKNATVNGCILEEVKDWQFPPPRGGTRVTVDYPFVFESSVK